MIIPNKFNNLKELETWLNRVPQKTSRYVFKGAEGFEKSKRLLSLLGNPQDAVMPIHVAGTSGKGSVCILLSSMLLAHGKSVSTIMSPHVYSIKERYLFNGEQLKDEVFVDNFNSFIVKFNNVPERDEPSYFELLIAFGFYLNTILQPDFTVVETGVGGLLDTTNTISVPKICIITSIGIDHTAVLGRTIQEIAMQKAGIIKKNSLVISANQERSVDRLLSGAIEKMNAKKILTKRFSYEKLQNIQLNSKHQVENVDLAYTALTLITKPDRRLISGALDMVYLPGRFEICKFKDNLVILDGSHNTQKIQALKSAILQNFPTNRFTVFLAVTPGRDEIENAGLLKDISDNIQFVDLGDYKSDMQLNMAPKLKGEKTISISQAIRLFNQLNGRNIIVTGSFYILDYFKSVIEGNGS